MKTKITFQVQSELYSAGLTEDGEPYHAELFFVVAEHEDGRRWHHHAQFHGAKCHLTDEGTPYFEDIRCYARKQANAVMRLVELHYAEAGEACDFRSWEEASPRYGSTCWSAEDEYNLMDEEERARYY